MAYFLYGVLAFVLCAVLFGLGGFAGWKVHSFYAVRSSIPPPAEPRETLTPEQAEALERQKREYEATVAHFDNLLNYSAEMAYGIGDTITLERDG